MLATLYNTFSANSNIALVWNNRVFACLCAAIHIEHAVPSSHDGSSVALLLLALADDCEDAIY